MWRKHHVSKSIFCEFTYADATFLTSFYCYISYLSPRQWKKTIGQRYIYIYIKTEHHFQHKKAFNLELHCVAKKVPREVPLIAKSTWIERAYWIEFTTERYFHCNDKMTEDWIRFGVKICWHKLRLWWLYKPSTDLNSFQPEYILSSLSPQQDESKQRSLKIVKCQMKISFTKNKNHW